MKAKWASTFFAMAIALGTSAPRQVATADDAIDSVEIITVNGVPRADDAPIAVHLGDVVALSPDIVRVGGDCALEQGCPLNVELENFKWSADDNATDTCDAAEGT
jgi:hypothetical protein